MSERGEPASTPPERRSERLARIARELRENERAREAARIESAGGEGRIVHAPTRAELIMAALRAIAYAPFLWLTIVFFGGAFFNLDKIVKTYAKSPEYGLAMIFGTCVGIVLLADLVPKARPRDVALVRLAVRERRNVELSVLAAVIFCEMLVAIVALGVVIFG